MKLNYIYNPAGKIEYVVVPCFLWDKVKGYAEKTEKSAIKQKNKKFNPSEFRGMLSHHNFNIEHELRIMKKQWTRNI